MTEVSAAEGDRPPTLLVIGDIGRWEARGRALPRIENCHFAAPWEISPELLQTVQPRIVLSGLTDGLTDAVEIGQSLHQMGFEGAYRAVVISLPDPETVRREVLEAAPGLDFDIYVLSD